MIPETIARHAGVARWMQSRTRVWIAFGAVHAWLTLLGVVLMPKRAFYDIDLYRFWIATGLDGGPWPVFDQRWVYPVGGLLPMLVPAALSTTSTSLYALGWCALVTVLDAAAVWALLRRGGADGAWWWLAFLFLLGPVAMGRIDAILAPIVIVALLAVARRPRVAAALLTLGAWVKVAPGVLILPLLVVVRRPVRNVVVPAALVCAVVLGTVAAGGGLTHVWSFLFAQDTRGLQVEAVAASPWTLAGLVRSDVTIYLNSPLTTWEIAGPGTAAIARALDVLLPLAVAVVALLLWRARSHPVEVLLWGSLALSAVLIVFNKVGSPQYIGWLAPPLAVALTLRTGMPDDARALGRAALARAARAVLVIAGLTQIIFPLAYRALLNSNPVITIVLVTRNAAMVALLVGACVLLWHRGRPSRAS